MLHKVDLYRPLGHCWVGKVDEVPAMRVIKTFNTNGLAVPQKMSLYNMAFTKLRSRK